MTTKRQRSLYARTVHGLEKAIAAHLALGRELPLVVLGEEVLGFGGPPSYRQPGPTISLTVNGKVYTATRFVARTVRWSIDLRVDETAGALLAPLIEAAKQHQGRDDIDARDAIELAVHLMRPGSSAGAASHAA